jgi:restriction system protein
MEGGIFKKRVPTIYLTEKGQKISFEQFDVQTEVIEPANRCWEELKGSREDVQKKSEDDFAEEDVNIQDRHNEEIKDRLLTAIANMSPQKFEQFSRLLITKMGVKFIEKGVQISNDGGIDGFGYHLDPDDFRTAKVVIQCKRYNSGSVSEPVINSFLGAMSKFQADYGVIITNSKFTKAAREAALQGQPIRLIDGEKLTDLIIQYELGISPVKTYVLSELYDVDGFHIL